MQLQSGDYKFFCIYVNYTSDWTAFSNPDIAMVKYMWRTFSYLFNVQYIRLQTTILLNISTLISLHQALTLLHEIQWCYQFLNSMHRNLIDQPAGMAMLRLDGRTQGRRKKPKGVRKIKRRADFTGCQPRDSFPMGTKSPGSWFTCPPSPLQTWVTAGR